MLILNSLVSSFQPHILAQSTCKLFLDWNYVIDFNLGLWLNIFQSDVWCRRIQFVLLDYRSLLLNIILRFLIIDTISLCLRIIVRRICTWILWICCNRFIFNTLIRSTVDRWILWIRNFCLFFSSFIRRCTIGCSRGIRITGCRIIFLKKSSASAIILRLIGRVGSVARLIFFRFI